MRAGTAELWLATCRDQQRWPGHREGKKGREKLLRGVWYCFYGESPKPTGPRDGQMVLQLHPALDLLHIRSFREGVRMKELRPAVHGVLLLGEM